MNILINFFLSGILFGCGPCLASCGPILISYVIGTERNSLGAWTAYILFSVSRVFVYIVLSLAVFFLGRLALERLLGEYSRYIFFLGGSFIVFAGFFMLRGKNLQLKLFQRLPYQPRRLVWFSFVMFGLITGLVPCAPLLAVLSYVGLISKSAFSSFFYSLSFGLGTIISPLILLVIFAANIPRFFAERKSIYSRYVNFACGLIIILLGLQLISKTFV